MAGGLRSGVNLLATADPQFDSIPGLTVFKPDDLWRISRSQSVEPGRDTATNGWFPSRRA